MSLEKQGVGEGSQKRTTKKSKPLFPMVSSKGVEKGREIRRGQFLALFDITNAIARQEDSTWNPVTQSYSKVNPNSLAQKNNNPGNLRWNPAHPEYTPGAVGPGAGGFAKYATIQDGITDLNRQIGIDANRDLDLSQFISKYAPSSENQTNSYIENVKTWLGLDTASVKLKDIIGGTIPTGYDGLEDSETIDASINPFGGSTTLLVLGGIGLLLIAKLVKG